MNGAPEGGYLIIDASQSLNFNDDNVLVYADGQQSNNWYLHKDGNRIYLKPQKSQPQPPTVEKWYYANSTTDMGLSSWTMNNNPKIGVKFLEGDATAEFANTKTITMTKSGNYNEYEYQIGEGHTLTVGAKITGDAGLKKTGAGTLILTADNDYEGDTYIEEGTLTLVTPDPATDHKGTLKGGTTITVDGALHMNDSSKAQSILSGQKDIFGNRASSGDGATSIGLIRLINGGILQNDSAGNHITVSCVVEMENGIIQVKEAGAGSDSGGNFLFDNAIHVLSGENNQITARAIAIRRHDYATYDQDNNQYAGYFNVEEGATLTMTSEVKNYNDQTIPFVKTGKGELILNNYSDSEICRFTNLNGDFIVREGKVISNKKKDPQSTFGKGAVIVEKDGWLECHVSNQFGYENTVQKDITVYGTLKPSTNTHMHELNLIGGTVETEYVTSASGDGLDFHNRAGKITSSGESIIKSKVTSGKAADKGGPGTMQFDVTDGNLTITGLIVGTSPFTKTGAGTLTLTNANTMSDSFTITNGVLVAGNASALGTGAVTITGDATTNAVGQLTIGALPAEPLDLTVSGLVTLNGGQINFDFTADDFDTLIAANGFQFDTGTFNLHFASGTEATLYQNAPEAGYQIVSITGGSYSGDEDLSDFLSGINQDWTLTATNDGIYLGKSSTPVQESEYWNPISDDGIDWPIDGENKIGVKYDDESNEGDPKTASHDQNITLDADGDFIIGEDYEFEQAGPISGNGKLTKTGAGALFLTGENSYKGGTDIEEGSVVLVTDDESDGTAGVGPIEIAENGELVYNVAANQTKTIDNAITGKGTITKTGAGTLQANGAGDTPLQAGEFNVEQGRLDLMGEFTGDVHVVGPLDDDGNEVAAVLSPGNSVGNATVYGDVTIDAGATGLFEFSAYNNDPLLRSFDTLSIENDGQFITSEDAEKIIKLSFLSYDDAKEWANEENDPYLIIEGGGFTDGAPYSAWLANFNNMFDLLGGADGLFLVPLGAQDMPGVPEPSTWALLLLGAAGLCWMRRRR